MAVAYNFKKGIDLPPWEWLPQAPQMSYTGCSNTYDGTRYMYWVMQYGAVAGGSTTSLYRYDTWTGGWQLLAAGVVSGSGLDIEIDSTRLLCLLARTAFGFEQTGARERASHAVGNDLEQAKMLRREFAARLGREGHH